MPLETVKDIMIPIEEYAVVDENASMMDALYALEKAQENMPPDKHPHRAVLIKGSDGSIVGKLGHHAFLAGLEPHYKNMLDSARISRSGFSTDFLIDIMEHMDMWSQDFDTYVKRAMKTKVSEVMHPLTEHIDADATIGKVLHNLIMFNTLSLIVTDDTNNVVGIIRLSDVFSVVTKIMRKRAASLQP